MHRLVGISEPTSRSYTWDSWGKQRVGIHARYFPSCYHLYNFLNRKKKIQEKSDSQCLPEGRAVH